MADIIAFPQTATAPRTIDLASVEASRARRILSPDIILPAGSEATIDLATEHAAEPIKSLEDIDKVSRYLIENERYRDNMMFILGINFGLRISDLLQLRFYMLIDENCAFRNTFPILEKKTRNTRKVKRNRYITINDAVVDAVTLFLQHTPSKLDDYLFKGTSNRCGGQNKPMTRMSADRILKEVAEDCGITAKISTHSLRKTFGYHQMVMSGNDPRKLLLLQKMFGHSTSAQTLDYIGITGEEIEDAYLNLNLGARNNYRSRFGHIGESSATA